MPDYTPRSLVMHRHLVDRDEAERFISLVTTVQRADCHGRLWVDLDDMAREHAIDREKIVPVLRRLVEINFIYLYEVRGVCFAQVALFDVRCKDAFLRSRISPLWPAPPPEIWDLAHCSLSCRANHTLIDAKGNRSRIRDLVPDAAPPEPANDAGELLQELYASAAADASVGRPVGVARVLAELNLAPPNPWGSSPTSRPAEPSRTPVHARDSTCMHGHAQARTSCPPAPERAPTLEYEGSRRPSSGPPPACMRAIGIPRMHMPARAGTCTHPTRATRTEGTEVRVPREPRNPRDWRDDDETREAPRAEGRGQKTPRAEGRGPRAEDAEGRGPRAEGRRHRGPRAERQGEREAEEGGQKAPRTEHAADLVGGGRARAPRGEPAVVVDEDAALEWCHDVFGARGRLVARFCAASAEARSQTGDPVHWVDVLGEAGEALADMTADLGPDGFEALQSVLDARSDGLTNRGAGLARFVAGRARKKREFAARDRPVPRRVDIVRNGEVPAAPEEPPDAPLPMEGLRRLHSTARWSRDNGSSARYFADAVESAEGFFEELDDHPGRDEASRMVAEIAEWCRQAFEAEGRSYRPSVPPPVECTVEVDGLLEEGFEALAAGLRSLAVERLDDCRTRLDDLARAGPSAVVEGYRESVAALEALIAEAEDTGPRLRVVGDGA